MAKEGSSWNGHPVLHEDHVAQLDALAGVHEFRHRLPREQAEERAYRDYTRDRALDAAAHHLLGTRAAHAAAHDDEAGQHAQAYAAAMHAAGHDPAAEPPAEVMDRIKDSRPKLVNFKAHPADGMWAPAEPQAAGTEDTRAQELLGKLRGLKSANSGE